MENQNRNIKQAVNMWFGMSPLLVIGIGAVILAITFYMYNGGFNSRVATAPMSPTTTNSPMTPTTPTTPTR